MTASGASGVNPSTGSSPTTNDEQPPHGESLRPMTWWAVRAFGRQLSGTPPVRPAGGAIRVVRPIP